MQVTARLTNISLVDFLKDFVNLSIKLMVSFLKDMLPLATKLDHII